MDYVFAPTEQVVLPVAGRSDSFPVQRVFCIGRNYRWQANESAPRNMPTWFLKPPQAVVPARGTLAYPSDTSDFCHEIELVVALGRGGSNLDPARIETEHVWGYAVGMDLTRRDLQQQAKAVGGPWAASKAFDQSAPCTPVVPVDVCGHPRHGAIWLSVNGQERQRSDVGELLWPVSELVAMLSRAVTLLPGDLVFTGTPAGVGPLHPGDVVRGGISGIGEFSVTVDPAGERRISHIFEETNL
ncbi:fumarylacetoacetate hydrolase family protein [Variovorax sp. YR216]|uniref:fumarylacetoacetate hydrolase family protein n=1 Tax=Variovorax sp. YR216 TaxID=1882828 RepID=UPI0008999456|nr:fumarylacetoacetate hydrolase family protein [Variovorax sp. YR216]SEB07812.1 fumarylpyruvate hydrolase [Variovorax sp. YR216]